MIEIRKFKDIAKIQDSQQELRGYVYKLFMKLHRALEPDMPVHQFDLSDEGYIVILERNDDIRKLAKIGLAEENGLLGAVPEMLTSRRIKDGKDEKIFYQGEFIFNNEFYMYILFFREDFYKQLDEWIQINLEKGVRF